MPDFDHSKCKNPIHAVKVFGRYFALQKATTWWNFTDADGTEKIAFILVSKIKMKNREAVQIIFFKYLLNIAKV